ncbi:MAG: glycosyltransferase [Paracoccaceae bacterium]|jgi:glycosyltransferase involved in cell wall biosynthesis|nr:glycosyltransferase [Paracoccaceae bacterium]
MSEKPDITVIIPANNEGAFIGQCMSSVLASNGPEAVEIIVAANGCTDNTERLAEGFRDAVNAKGWALNVLSLTEGSKLKALNAADAAVNGKVRVYLDADVTIAPDLLTQLHQALAVDAPRYGSGTINFTATDNWATSLYARTYSRVPYIANGLPGAGLFAVNDAGREKWGDFPKIISDDTYVRLLFTPDERVRVPATYEWPLVDGYANLVRVRRRQNAGVHEIEHLYPEIIGNDDKLPVSLWGKFSLALKDPISFAVYGSVQLIVKFTPSKNGDWQRGR